MNRLTFLISTLDDGIYSVRDYSHVKAEFLIVHQQTDKSRESEYRRYVSHNLPSHYQYHVMTGKGLSRSRNAALSLCTTRYAYILDDDVDIYAGAEDVVMECFDRTKAGCITFPHSLPPRDDRSAIESLRSHNIISAASVSSIDIALDLVQARLHFDERFGLGTRLPSGEEYILLVDALRSGVSVLQAPFGATLHEGKTSGADFFSTPNKISAKAQMFRRITGSRCSLLALAFYFKKLPVVIRRNCFLKFTRYFFSPING